MKLRPRISNLSRQTYVKSTSEIVNHTITCSDDYTSHGSKIKRDSQTLHLQQLFA